MQIIILGMHRSGTSAVSRLINMMGTYLGPEEKRMAAQPDNPKGFWERSDVMRLNNEILHAAGGSWDQVSQINLKSISGPDKEQFGGCISDILLEMDAHRPWSLKDPRMCLTLPVWRSHLEIPVFLFVFRNPVQVAQSLAKRNNLPLFIGIALWEYYTVKALNGIKGEKVIFIRYEDVMSDPVEATASIYKNLKECGVNGLKMPDQKEIEAFISADLFHHKDNNEVFDEYLNVNQLNLVQFLQENPDIRRLSTLKVSAGSLEVLNSYSLQILQSKGLKALENEKNDIHSELKQLHLDLNTAATEISRLRSAFTEHEKVVKDQKLLLSAQTKTVAHMKEQLSEKEMALVEISAKNDAQSKRIEILEREKDEIKLKQKRAQADLRSAIAEVARLNQILQQKEGVIRDKETRQEAIQKEVVHLKDQLSEKKIALAEILTTCKEQNNQINYIRKEKVEKALAAAIQIEKKTKTSAVSLEGDHTQIREELITLKSIFNELIHQSKSKDEIIFGNVQKIEEKLFLLLSNERQKFIGNYRKTMPSRFLLRLAGCVIHPRRTFSYFHDRKIVLNSQYFDENYYLQNNHDVLLNYADPVEHFCLYGWKEGRNPHPSFDVGFYLSNNPDVAQAKVNPLVHFEKYGRAEGRKISSVWADNNLSVSNGESVSLFKENEAIKKEKNIEDVELKESLTKYFELKLKCFLNVSSSKIEFPYFEKPLVSIILVLYNRAELTFGCLESIKAFAGFPYEIIIVDNNSKDETPLLLKKLKNVTVERSHENVGFLKACNMASDHAAGEYILFLNNDTQILPGTIGELLSVFDEYENIGAVGGRLIYPNGRLQEAGCILWKEGNALGYGRNDDPFNYKYSYLKDVYFVSGALLLTKTGLFVDSGKFDERYAPAYSEEVDYCIRLHYQGYRVVYNPFSMMIHHEFGSGKSANAIELQKTNNKKLAEKWDDYIQSSYTADMKNIIFAREFRSEPYPEKSILFVDDRVPDPSLGSGLPRCLDLLMALKNLGFRITFFPLQFPDGNLRIIQLLQRKGIEVIYENEVTDQKLDFIAYFTKNMALFDTILISRPHNMQEISESNVLDHFNGKIIYDCEALFSAREILFHELNGKKLSSDERKALIEKEISLSRKADCIITVTQAELNVYMSHGAKEGGVVGHVRNPSPLPNDYESRSDILFVGGFLGSPSPNEDAVMYFVEEIFSKIQKSLPGVKLYIVGNNKLDSIRNLSSDTIIVTGRVDNLEDYYKNCRIFVIPTRYAAGIPYKFHEAASFGLPMVVTPLIHNQVNGMENEHYLVGHTPKEFAKKCVLLYSDKNRWRKIRKNGLMLVERDCNKKTFCESLRNIFELNEY